MATATAMARCLRHHVLKYRTSLKTPLTIVAAVAEYSRQFGQRTIPGGIFVCEGFPLFYLRTKAPIWKALRQRRCWCTGNQLFISPAIEAYHYSACDVIARRRAAFSNQFLQIWNLRIYSTLYHVQRLDSPSAPGRTLRLDYCTESNQQTLCRRCRTTSPPSASQRSSAQCPGRCHCRRSWRGVRCPLAAVKENLLWWMK